MLAEEFHELCQAALLVGAQVIMNVPAEIIFAEVVIVFRAIADDMIEGVQPKTFCFPKVLAQGSSEDLVYVVGTTMATEQPIPAKALMDFLAGPEAKKVYAAKGLKTS